LLRCRAKQKRLINAVYYTKQTPCYNMQNTQVGLTKGQRQRGRLTDVLLMIDINSVAAASLAVIVIMANRSAGRSALQISS